MLQLYIGNKNYSSWSMRPWVAMRQLGIAFDEIAVRFDSFEQDSTFKQTLAALTPVGKVPLLVHDGLVIWDTLAIAEYLHEEYPQAGIWPRPFADRARARSLCAEMHSGFGSLRSLCPMNIEAHLPEVGERLWAEHDALRQDVARIVQMWSTQLQTHGGPMLFGQFSMVDAFFAPVCMRLHTYALPLPPAVTSYVERVRALPAVQAWITAALAKHDFRAFEEPYRNQP